MNCTTKNTFTLNAPAGVSRGMDLMSKKSMDYTQPLPVGPMSTVVLDLKDAR